MTMAYVRKTYGVPCRRGVLIRGWYDVGGSWRLASNAKSIRSATYEVFAEVSYHPTWHLEYLDSEGYRLWPVTDDQFNRAEIPRSVEAHMAPVRPT